MRLKNSREVLKGASLLFLCFLALNISSTGDAHANTGDSVVGFGLGEVVLLGNFGTNYSNGLGYDLFYDYEASQVFGVELNLGLNNHSSSSSSTDSLSMKSVVPDLKINLAYVDKLTLYAIAGFGLYKLNETLHGVSAGVTTFGFNLGTGFDMRLFTHFQFGTVLSFQNVFSATDTSPAAQNTSLGGTYLRLFLNVAYVF